MARSTRRTVRRAANRQASAVAIVLAVIVALTASTGIVVATVHGVRENRADDRADAAAADVFDPGFIISDARFFASASMSDADIQEFLDSRSCVPRDDVPCLADYRQTTPTRPSEYAHCARYDGRSDERASTIIGRIARACGISPQVLLVLLQKEQSLVTRPSAYGYQRSTGYGCPDTAACDERYFGFFNQVYRAAWQFREYGDSDEWRYRIGTVEVQYHPDPACGASAVDIRNQATANLYNYTPYQPNAETIANPRGPAGACSTYGNLNFFRLFTSWFGDAKAEVSPTWLADCLNRPDGTRCTPLELPGTRPMRAPAYVPR